MKALSALTVLALCAAVSAVSCQKRIIEQEPAAAGSRTFTCVIASPDTKVAVSDAGKATWEEGDEILVHGAGSSNRVVVTLTGDDISEDGKTATITVEGVEPYDRYSDKGYTSTFYALYPASAVPSGNLYYYGRFTETNHLLMAAYNEGDSFVFYNLCGAISFTVSGDFDSYVFSGNGKETVGYSFYQCRLAATDGDPVLQFTYGNESDGGTSGPLTSISGTVVADGETVNYVGIPLGADLTKGFTFKFKDGDSIVRMATSSAPVNIGRSMILPLGDITGHLEEYIPADHESEIPTEGAVDLSADGTANCYIITEPGIYKLPAVKGNSDSPTDEVYGAELLWETYGNAETVTKNSVLAAVDFEDDWLYLQTPETLHPGNALVAAKDAKGKILWSWHLWIPETTISTGTYSLATAPLMDRNLGALVAAEAGSSPVDVRSLGLAYEWGRKDPFPGPKALNSSSPATVAGQATAIGREKISVEESVVAPTTFVTVDNDSWSVEEDTDLWTVDGAKNIYDPCPPGYKVPTRQEAPAFFVSDLSAVGGWETSTSGYWFTVGRSDAVFPMGGYVDDCSSSYKFSYTGSRVAVWSADASGAVKAYAVDVRFGSRQQVSGPARSRGGYVRCIAEGGATEPFVNAEGMPEMGSYTKITLDDVTEISGLCLSADKSFLWGVGDKGSLYRIGFDGTVSTQWTHEADMEGITIHPATGDLYIAVEGEQKVYKVPVPDYDNYKTVFYVQEAVDGSYGNSGLEGITYYKDDMLYVGSQYGATLWTYTLGGTKVSKKLLTTIAPGIEEVGGLFYDPETDWLWVTDSEAKKLFVFAGDVSELLAIYDISFISNAESVCVDHAHSCVWVGSDDSTSKLFKIEFT